MTPGESKEGPMPRFLVKIAGSPDPFANPRSDDTWGQEDARRADDYFG